jgi:hypothetical protein
MSRQICVGPVIPISPHVHAYALQTSPRGVYEHHLALLNELMAKPGAARRDKLDGTLS